MNAAWGMQSDMGEITLMLSRHKTTENFEKTGAFTVAFGTADTVLISDYFGVETGKSSTRSKKQAVTFIRVSTSMRRSSKNIP